MDKANLAEIVQKEFDLLTAEKNEALAKIAEIDRRLEPINAFLNAGKKKDVKKKVKKTAAQGEPKDEADAS